MLEFREKIVSMLLIPGEMLDVMGGNLFEAGGALTGIACYLHGGQLHLTVGDGDLSYSLALRRCFGEQIELTATTLLSEAELTSTYARAATC